MLQLCCKMYPQPGTGTVFHILPHGTRTSESVPWMRRRDDTGAKGERAVFQGHAPAATSWTVHSIASLVAVGCSNTGMFTFCQLLEWQWVELRPVR